MPWRHRLPSQVARTLRQQSTPAEVRLWNVLRDRQVDGAKFRRQYRIAETGYVVDFCCTRVRLILEIDGDIHQYQTEADRVRQADIEQLGYRFLRFSNQAVLDHLDQVVDQIRAALHQMSE